MRTVALVAARRQPLAWRDWARSMQRPGVVRRVYALVAAGWLALFLHAVTGRTGIGIGRSGATASPTASMVGMHGSAGSSSTSAGLLVGGQIAMWAPMVVATMLPLLAPNLAFVERRTPRCNRGVVMAAMVGGWATVWCGACLALATVAWLLERAVGVPASIGVAFGVASAWQFTGRKRRSLVRCHRTCAPPIQRRRGVAIAGRFGGSLALDCVATCSPAMVAMALAGHSLAVVAPLGWVAWAERRRPHHDPRLGHGAAVIGLVGIVVLVASLAT